MKGVQLLVVLLFATFICSTGAFPRFSQNENLHIENVDQKSHKPLVLKSKEKISPISDAVVEVNSIESLDKKKIVNTEIIRAQEIPPRVLSPADTLRLSKTEDKSKPGNVHHVRYHGIPNEPQVVAVDLKKTGDENKGEAKPSELLSPIKTQQMKSEHINHVGLHEIPKTIAVKADLSSTSTDDKSKGVPKPLDFHAPIDTIRQQNNPDNTGHFRLHGIPKNSIADAPVPSNSNIFKEQLTDADDNKKPVNTNHLLSGEITPMRIPDLSKQMPKKPEPFDNTHVGPHGETSLEKSDPKVEVINKNKPRQNRNIFLEFSMMKPMPKDMNLGGPGFQIPLKRIYDELSADLNMASQMIKGLEKGIKNEMNLKVAGEPQVGNTKVSQANGGSLLMQKMKPVEIKQSNFHQQFELDNGAPYFPKLKKSERTNMVDRKSTHDSLTALTKRMKRLEDATEFFYWTIMIVLGTIIIFPCVFICLIKCYKSQHVISKKPGQGSLQV